MRHFEVDRTLVRGLFLSTFKSEGRYAQVYIDAQFNSRSALLICVIQYIFIDFQ